MSNTWLNVRFGFWHLQIVMLTDWLGEIRMHRSPVRISFNAYQVVLRENEPATWRWFKVHELRRPW